MPRDGKRHKQQRQMQKRADTDTLANEAHALVQIRRSRQKKCKFQSSVLHQPCSTEAAAGLEAICVSGFPQGTKESWSGIRGEHGATPEIRRHHGILIDG